jgi:hypothetical protein
MGVRDCLKKFWQIVVAENGGSRGDEFIKEPREKLTQDI